MKDLSLSEWKSKLEVSSKSKILDVRSPEEWQGGIIPNALTIDILEIDAFMREINKLDKEIPYFVLCILQKWR